MELSEPDRFQDAIHKLCSALHWERCDPGRVTITLPHDQWWRLWCSLDRKYRLMDFDGRGTLPEHFRYMGLTFKSGASPAEELKKAERALERAEAAERKFRTP